MEKNDSLFPKMIHHFQKNPLVEKIFFLERNEAMSEIFYKISSGRKRCFLGYPVHDKIYFKNIQVVTDSSSDSPLLRPSGSGRPRTVYLERVFDIYASQQTFNGQKMLPQDVNLAKNGSGLSRATSLGEGLHRWQCNMTLSYISRWHVTKLRHITRLHVTALCHSMTGHLFSCHIITLAMPQIGGARRCSRRGGACCGAAQFSSFKV